MAFLYGDDAAPVPAEVHPGPNGEEEPDQRENAPNCPFSAASRTGCGIVTSQPLEVTGAEVDEAAG